MNARKTTRPESLTSLAKERIREAIVSGALPFGWQLSENVLAAQLGISKTPVREGLLQLKFEGLVDIRPQAGTYVFQPTADQIRDMCQFREVIELSALELAMRNDAAFLAQQLTLALRALPKHEHSVAPLHAQDATFHETLIECCESDCLQQAYLLIGDKIKALRARLSTEDERVDACMEKHSAILSLVREGDIANARIELRLHIRSTENAYLRAALVRVVSKADDCPASAVNAF